jgi:ribosome-associated protein
MRQMATRTSPGPAEYARLAVDVASDRQASDIVMLDIRDVSDFADYFVILTAESPRQVDALVQEIEKALKEQGATLSHREGGVSGGWVLLDFGDVIVHLFRPEDRLFYHLEGLWSDAVETVRIQ